MHIFYLVLATLYILMTSIVSWLRMKGGEAAITSAVWSSMVIAGILYPYMWRRVL